MTAEEISEELRDLAGEMNRVANAMVDYADISNNNNQVIKHAREMLGASQKAYEWAAEICHDDA